MFLIIKIGCKNVNNRLFYREREVEVVFPKKNNYSIRGMIARLIMRVFAILPVQNKVVFSSFYGKQFSDNPLSIFLEMKRQNKNYKYVWLLDTNRKIEGAIVVPYYSLRSIYHLATAKLWIDNSRKNNWLVKRKEQIYVQTWHGDVCIKKIEKDAEEKLGEKYKECAIHDSEMADLMISGSKFRTDNYKSAFWYDGEILELGNPKSDVLYYDQNIIKRKVCKILDIPIEKKIVLYVPTFRDSETVDCYDLNYNSLLECLKKCWGGDWVVIVRLHPKIQEKEDFILYDNRIINGTSYDLCEELVLASEVLITDYSGTMFAGLESGKKVFLFAVDIEEYLQERGTYFCLEEMPFPLARDNNELCKNISGFDEERYLFECTNLKKRIGFFNSENSTKKVVEELFRRIERRKI